MRAVLFSNGEVPDPLQLRSILHADDTIISADGGMRHLHALGQTPHTLVGDMDSIDPDRLAALEKAGIEILRFPPAKDETDLELALTIIEQRGFKQVVIVGALGGRFDQTIANLWLLAERSSANFDISFNDGCECVYLILGELTVSGEVGDLISLIPYAAPVQGITTEGLEYPLDNETLVPDKTRGLSNVLLANQARISIKSGRLLCIHRRKSAS